MKTAPKLSVEQTFFVSQRMLNSLQLLQMDRLSLERHLAEQLMENPVLEFPAAPAGKKPEAVSWERPEAELPGRADAYETLEFFLTDQLSRMKDTGPVLRLCRKLVRLLDENGYLRADQLPQGYPENPDYPQALALLQSLEPAGVGAGDLKECLLLQLRRAGLGQSLAAVLVENHLEDISRRSHARILRSTGADPEQLQEALSIIVNLTPRPGAAFAGGEKTAYIHPDFVITLEGEDIVITQEERSFPLLTVSDDYRRLYSTTEDPQVRRYLKERFAAAKRLITGLENRKTTTRRCLEAIVQVQQGFFKNPSRQLVPLSLEQVSKLVDLHISTVSRAVSGKYLEFEGRTYPLKHFFVRGLRDSREQITTGQVRELIRQIVSNEDPEHPLSDQQIVQILQQGGGRVSRRTVAKYREQMGIPSSQQRRTL